MASDGSVMFISHYTWSQYHIYGHVHFTLYMVSIPYLYLCIVLLANAFVVYRSVPANAFDQIYCMQLAQNAVHGSMAGYTAFSSGVINNRTVSERNPAFYPEQCYIKGRATGESDVRLLLGIMVLWHCSGIP